MNDFTCKEFRELIESFNLIGVNKEDFLADAGLPKNAKHMTEELSNSLVIPNLKQPVLNYLHNLLSQNPVVLEPKNIEKLLERDAWFNAFNERNQLRITKLSGSQKNRYVARIYNLHKEVKSLNFKNPINRDSFINFFSSATKLNIETEEDAIVKVLYDLFENKNKNDLEFFKEIFAIYLENVATNPKHEFRVNTIKKWAEKEDFSNITPRYKNIRTLFENINTEEIFTASSKKYDLTKIVKEKGSSLNSVKNNFIALNQFIEEKLRGNSNLQSFVIIDEKICHRVLFVYQERDHIIDAAIQMHELFFNRLGSSRYVENELINEIWDKLILKAELGNELSENSNAKKGIKI